MYANQGFPDDFSDGGVTIMMNQDSGNVFFTNSEYEVAMMNGDRLESFYSTPYEGREGFADELVDEFLSDMTSWNREDAEYLFNMGIIGEDTWDDYCKITDPDYNSEEDEDDYGHHDSGWISETDENEE